MILIVSHGWLPRIRGDRPWAGQTHAYYAWAPPHPRGSTRYTDSGAHWCGGSPASAGIDPRPCAPPWCCQWLPRIRGDRPTARPAAAPTPVAPPHPRGSTPGRTWWTLSETGSPASAGIDPERVPVRAAGCGLPRIRGDRPDMSAVIVAKSEAPPHPRGSTQPDVRQPQQLAGSPASAGIDPGWLATATNRWRLPRIRGDRPFTAATTWARSMAPPHPRGSTQG